MTTKEVEPTSIKAVAHPTASAQELELLDSIVRGGPYPEQSADAGVIAEEIANRILEAETPDQIGRMAQSEKLPDWPKNVPVLVHGFKLNRSDYYDPKNPDTGLSAYAVVEIERLDDGTHSTVTIGARNPIATLRMILAKGWWDTPWKLIEKDTTRDRTALWLVPA